LAQSARILQAEDAEALWTSEIMASDSSNTAFKQVSDGSEMRRAERIDCFLRGQMSAKKGEVPCTVLNINAGGVGLLVASTFHLDVNEKVTVTANEFGSVEGFIRWAAHPRYGFELANKNERPRSFVHFHDSLRPERVLEERMAFMGLDRESRASIASLKTLVDRELPVSLDKFYDKVRKTPAANLFFSSDSRIARAKAAQLRHWVAISSGEFGVNYFINARQVGETHAKVGVDPRWFIGGYGMVAEHLIKTAISERWPKRLIGRSPKEEAEELGAALGALVKAIFLDMDISISVYLDSAGDARLLGEGAARDKERSLVGNSIGVGLAELAHKNLSHRITDGLPDAYARVQGDFNSAMEQLESAMRSVSETVDNVCSGMNEISTASGDLAMRTEQQAATLEQTATLLNEITSKVCVTADGAKEAHAAMALAREDAEQSGQVVRQAVDAMSKIAASSREIGQIINVIDEIAFQTNLLALNAGVEAARAGEAGRGFAVVAAEVRALAQRATGAATQINHLIATSTAQVKDGVALVLDTGKAFDRIADQVTKINGVIAQIATSAEEQAAGLQGVNQSVADMDVMTQQNAAMAEEATAASRSLEQDGKRLAALIDEFEIAKDRDGLPAHERGNIRVVNG
jgi:methyl-accepting chemotaxis protein